MCILIIKKVGVDMPDRETLAICYENNPDGSGFMWLRPDGQMEGQKGYFSFAEFYQDLGKKQFHNEDLVVIHHRIATHGGINPGCCHPFPISNIDENIKATHFVARDAMAHNGVIQGLPEAKGISDTMMFVKEILSDTAILNNLDSSGVNHLIESYVYGSRVAVMKEGQLYLYGKFEDVNGVLYSNSSYKSRYFKGGTKLWPAVNSKQGQQKKKGKPDMLAGSLAPAEVKTTTKGVFKDDYTPKYAPIEYDRWGYPIDSEEEEWMELNRLPSDVPKLTYRIEELKEFIREDLLVNGSCSLTVFEMLNDLDRETMVDFEASFDEWVQADPEEADNIFEELWEAYEFDEDVPTVLMP